MLLHSSGDKKGRSAILSKSVTGRAELFAEAWEEHRFLLLWPLEVAGIHFTFSAAGFDLSYISSLLEGCLWVYTVPSYVPQDIITFHLSILKVVSAEFPLWPKVTFTDSGHMGSLPSLPQTRYPYELHFNSISAFSLGFPWSKNEVILSSSLALFAPRHCSCLCFNLFIFRYLKCPF